MLLYYANTTAKIQKSYVIHTTCDTIFCNAML